MAYDQSAVDQMFQQSLGRAGTAAEHDFLRPYVDQGFLSPYQIGQYLGSTPEALQSRQAGQQTNYQNLLTQNNQQILGQAADAANASFAQNGRQFSSGQGNAVIQAGQQLAAQQAPMIANFYGANAGGLNDAYATQGQNALSRGYGLQDQQRQRQWQIEDYNRQQDDFNNYLAGQSTRNLQGALIKGGIGIGTGFINNLAQGLGSKLVGGM